MKTGTIIAGFVIALSTSIVIAAPDSHADLFGFSKRFHQSETSNFGRSITALNPKPKHTQSKREKIGTPIVQKPQIDTKNTVSRAPVYKPPMRGAPRARVGGGSRSTGNIAGVELSVLAPDHTGLTTLEAPSLYWYLSRLVSSRIEFTVNDEQSIAPVLEIQLEAPKQPGVQKISLFDYDIQLKPGVEYQWFVTLVPDPDQRSYDLISGGTVQHVKPSAALHAHLNGADAEELPYLYAGEGFWYDAIATVSQLIEANPANMRFREQRAALLEQVGLWSVEATDSRQRAPEDN